MTLSKRSSAAVLALAVATAPTLAQATCVTRDDMHALQAASLQQRLMVSAFQCKYLPQYNAFVIGHQPELQRYDAALLAFFKRDDPKGMATYNTYKTHLANIAALEDAHTNTFCAEVTVLYQKTAGSAPLDPLLDTLAPTDTAYASCVIPDTYPANPPVVASVPPPVVATVPPPAPPPVVASVDTATVEPAPPVKRPTGAGRALLWVTGLVRKAVSVVGIGDADDDGRATVAPAVTPQPIPAADQAPVAVSANRETTMNYPAPSNDPSPATANWDPNRPLIGGDPPAKSSPHKHKPRTEDDPLYGEPE